MEAGSLPLLAIAVVLSPTAVQASMPSRAEPVGAAPTATPPRSLNLNEIATPDDYPTAAVRAGEEGRTVVRLGIDEAGRPASSLGGQDGRVRR